MSSTASHLRGILVGCGFMGGMHAQIYHTLKNVDILAAVDNNKAASEKKLRELGVTVPLFTTLTEALSTVESDFVDICLPTHLHFNCALEAINAGKALFCEKPVTLSVEEANSLIAAAKAMNTFAQVGHCIRFWPEYQALVDFHKSKQGGKLLSLQLTRRSGRPNYSIDNWLNNPALSGGADLDLHIHDADFALYLLGHPNNTYSQVTRDQSGPAHIFSLLNYGHCAVSIEGGWNYPEKWGFQMSFQAIYEKAVLDYDSNNEKGLMICQTGKKPEALHVSAPDTKESTSGEGNIASLGGYFNELKYFTDCLKAGIKPTIATLEQARDSLSFVLEEIDNAH